MSAVVPRAEPDARASTLPLALSAAAYALLVLAGGRLLRDPDSHFHVAAGRWMLAHGRIPADDVFSHSMRGAPWTAHEWLAEIVFALAHDAGGWPLVVAATAAASSLALYALARHLTRWLPARHVALFTVFAAMLVGAHLHARPHVLALPCLAFFASELLMARAAKRAPDLRFTLLVVLWANLHGSFPLAAALALAFGLEALLAADGVTERAAALRGWGRFALTAALAGLLTPHGSSGFAYALGFAGDTGAIASLDEWSPPDFRVLQPLELWLLVLLGGGFALGLRVPPVRLALLLVLVHLALRHGRHGELLGLLAPLLLAPALGAVLPGASPTPRVDARSTRASRVLPVVAALLVYTFVVARVAPAAPAPETTPERALAAARIAEIDGPVLNAYEFGGYLVAQGVPTFVDLRTDVFGADFLRDYERAVLHGDAATLAALLARHRIAWTLLRPGMPALALLDRLPGWSRLYADELAVVHVRSAGAPPPAVPARP